MDVSWTAKSEDGEGSARLLVLERDVEGEDEAVLEALGHVGVASSVVEHEALDEAGVDVGEVLHLHHLDHVEVDRLERDLALDSSGLDLPTLGANDVLLPLPPYGEHGLDTAPREAPGEALVDLGREGREGDLLEDLEVDVPAGVEGDLEVVEEGREGVLGNLDAVCEDARVDALRGVALGLLEELADEEDDGGRSVSGHLVLGDGGTGDESCCGVLGGGRSGKGRRWKDGTGAHLDLHLGEENLAVLGHFELPSTVNKHLECSPGSCECGKGWRRRRQSRFSELVSRGFELD